MSSIYFFSGPCGAGKSTLANAFAGHLVEKCGKKQVYVIHGDDFHAGFVDTKQPIGAGCRDFFYWPDILTFNWECMLHTAEKVLTKGVDVIFDYVIEDELPLVQALAKKFQAKLYYVVLTADAQTISQRLAQRGNPELAERALFLKSKLEGMPENAGHLFEIDGLSIDEEIMQLAIEQYEIT